MNTAQKLALAAAVSTMALPAGAQSADEPITVTRPDIEQIVQADTIERLKPISSSPYEVNITHSHFGFNDRQSVIGSILPRDFKASLQVGRDDRFDRGPSFATPYAETEQDLPNEIAGRLFSGIDGLYPYANEDRLTFNFGAAAEAGQWAPGITVMWNGIMDASEEAEEALRRMPRPDDADYAIMLEMRITR